MIVDMFTPLYKPAEGGVQNATHSIARELNEHCNLRIHTFNIPSAKEAPRLGYHAGNLPTEEKIDGIYTKRYPFFHFPLIKFFSPSLIKAISRSNADIIHIQGFTTIFNNLLLQNMTRGKAFILTDHGLYEALDMIKKKPVIRWILTHSYLNRFDQIIALSNTDIKALRTIGYKRDNITVIPNGIDKNKFLKREKYIIEDGKKTILSVARFDTNKGHMNLIKALSIIRDKEDFKAYFIGAIRDSTYFSQIQSLVADMNMKDRITIGTSLSDAQLLDCYLASDIFVLPSKMETLPLVILEAMHAGLPVIATKVGGIPDVVKDNVNGYLVKPGDAEELADKLLKLLREDETRIRLGENSKREAQKFTWQDLSQQTLDLYNRILAEKKAL
jgi:glycosyltransferase involved in cell wall biosynthesis